MTHMTTFKIGQTVRRIEARHEHTPFKITNNYTLRQVEAEAGSYEVVKEVEDDLSFDLPEVKGNLRIHRKPFEECESCSA